MKILALDVSSSATGWAFSRPGQRPSFGLIRSRESDPAVVRIDGIVDSVGKVVAEYRPDLCLMEWSGGKQHGRINRKMSGLSVLGAAQGAVRESIRKVAKVETVDENTWTCSRSKASRGAEIAVIFPDYGAWAARGEDPGLDVADALGILEWRRGREIERRLMEQSA